MRAHAESINLEFEKDITVAEVCCLACHGLVMHRL